MRAECGLGLPRIQTHPDWRPRGCVPRCGRRGTVSCNGVERCGEIGRVLDVSWRSEQRLSEEIVVSNVT